MRLLTKTEGDCYYFSHETIEKLKKGEIRFINKDGLELTPSYFGAGLNGMNGRLLANNSSSSNQEGRE